jgi:hypothetical protein
MERWKPASALLPKLRQRCAQWRRSRAMEPTGASFLAAWSNFYVMTGTSAAALTGLMFVVITLVRGVERVSRNPDGIAAFSTPTVMHFCAALLVAAILIAPWRSLVYASVLLAIAGLYGIVYGVRVILRTMRITAYVPDLEDWAWYSALPLLAYAAIFAGAIGLAAAPARALFALAGGSLLLIFIGIRNAWDVVTFLAVGGGGDQS